jgi:hypothetical protein
MRMFTCLGVSAALFSGFTTIKHAAGESARKTNGNAVYGPGDLISDKASAAEIGNVYLSQCRSAIDSESISNTIIVTGGGPHATLDELRLGLSDQIRNDFRRGRTILVDGWVLSQTEAWVYAFVALTSTS